MGPKMNKPVKIALISAGVLVIAGAAAIGIPAISGGDRAPTPAAVESAREAVTRALGTKGIPRDKQGQYCQHGDCLPDEIHGLPPLGGPSRRK